MAWTARRWTRDSAEDHHDRVAMEEPFEIRVNGRSLAAIMRTPGGLEQDRELALGFLLTEGILPDTATLQVINPAVDKDGLPEENVVDVRLSELPPALLKDGEGRFERRFTVASSCGLCGKNSIDEVCRRLPPLPKDDFQISPEVLYCLPETLRHAQPVFDRTGGLHAAGLFNATGELLLLREDIGRHNAVDKIIGRMALDGQFPLENRVLLVSGRISFEIIQKALAARIPIVAAVSAPSSLALELADESGLTVVGFLRGHQMNVYTHQHRVALHNL